MIIALNTGSARNQRDSANCPLPSLVRRTTATPRATNTAANPRLNASNKGTPSHNRWVAKVSPNRATASQQGTIPPEIPNTNKPSQPG